MSTGDIEVDRGRLTQMTVLRGMIVGQLFTALLFATCNCVLGSGAFLALLRPHPGFWWLGGLLALAGNVAGMAAICGFVFAPPLSLFLICTRSMNWRQRLAGLAFEGIAEIATILALAPVCYD